LTAQPGFGETKPAGIICGKIMNHLAAAGRLGLTAEGICADKNEALRVACSHGHLEVAKWLVDNHGLVAANARARAKETGRRAIASRAPRLSAAAQYIGNTALSGACHNGHLAVAQWLVERFDLSAEDARAHGNEALRYACLAGNLNVAQWLAERFHLTAHDVRTHNNFALRTACHSGRLELAQWLAKRFELNVDDARANNNEALRWTCDGGHSDVAQWLADDVGITAEDARAKGNEALHFAYINSHYNLAQWLVDRFDLTADEIAPYSRLRPPAGPLVKSAAKQN
jgi:hypothetical protein